MAHSQTNSPATRLRRSTASALLLLAAGWICGCGGGTKTTTTGPTANAPATYFATAVAGAYSGSAISDSEYLSTYTVDNQKHTFAESIYTFGSGDQQGPQLDYSGTTSATARGLSEFQIDYSNSLYGSAVNSGKGITYNPPLSGNWFFELPDQAGGLVTLKGLPFVPLVAAEKCPSGSANTTYNFVSIPSYIGPNLAGSSGGISNWIPADDTAYGSVQVSSKGSNVTFGGIRQFSASGAAITSYKDLKGNPAAVTSVTGVCASTFYGNTISVPAEVLITNPGQGETISSPAVVAIGPTGLLLENNGETSNLVSNAQITGYQPFMGSGTGAMGFPQPTSQVSVSALTAAQYMGVTYGGGTGAKDWSSLITSFGFPSAPASCPTGSFAAPLFGGDFPGNDPTQSGAGSATGYGNCNLVVDLGTQDSSANGVFPHATVYVGAAFGGDQKAHSFPATAIAGQLGGKYAVFLIGVDTSGTPQQAWGIYLFQSN